MRPPVLTAILNDRNDRFPKPKGMGDEAMDRMAEIEYERRTLGGFKKKYGKCTVCYMVKTSIGSCNCSTYGY